MSPVRGLDRLKIRDVHNRDSSAGFAEVSLTWSRRLFDAARRLVRVRNRNVHQYRASAIDIERASSRVLALVGPVADISEDHICEVLTQAAESSPTVHIALNPRTDCRYWDYRSRDWRQAVTRRSDLDTTDLGQLLIQIHNRPGMPNPLEVLICGDYLVVDYSHGLGDGRLGAMLPAALLGRDEAARVASLSKRLPSSALWAALLRHFALHPSKAGKVLRLRKSNKQAPLESGGRRITDWESAKHSAMAHMEGGVVAELRDWTSSRFPGTTAAAATVAVVAAALRAEGVEVDEQVTMLVDCRRYFGRQHRDCHGNFVVGIPIRVPPGSSPSEVGGQMRQAIDSGRPLARLIVAEAKARLARPTGPPASRHCDVPDRIRLTISDLGRLTIFDHLRWRTGAQPPQAAAYVEPDGPDAIDLEVTEIFGVRTFTASFCSKMIAQSVIETAFKRMCEDPVRILRTIHQERHDETPPTTP
jgi:hypothetical protein